jgi:hypothetical protein
MREESKSLNLVEKHGMKRFVILISSLPFLLLACSENKPPLTLNEKNYIETQDSLIKYKSALLEFSGDDSTSISDFIKLDYKSYKSKYQLSEKEMDILRRTLNVRFETIKGFIEIKKNMFRSNINEHTSESQDSKGNYSFD